MQHYLIAGAEKFFEWCQNNDATATVCLSTACQELEIRVEIYGEYEFYRKRSCGFEDTLEEIIADFANQRALQDNKSRYEQQEITIKTLQGCLAHYKQELAALKASIRGDKE